MLAKTRTYETAFGGYLDGFNSLGGRIVGFIGEGVK
jgi:hypothetical protein